MFQYQTRPDVSFDESCSPNFSISPPLSFLRAQLRSRRDRLAKTLVRLVTRCHLYFQFDRWLHSFPVRPNWDSRDTKTHRGVHGDTFRPVAHAVRVRSDVTVRRWCTVLHTHNHKKNRVTRTRNHAIGRITLYPYEAGVVLVVQSSPTYFRNNNNSHVDFLDTVFVDSTFASNRVKWFILYAVSNW